MEVCWGNRVIQDKDDSMVWGDRKHQTGVRDADVLG